MPTLFRPYFLDTWPVLIHLATTCLEQIVDGEKEAATLSALGLQSWYNQRVGNVHLTPAPTTNTFSLSGQSYARSGAAEVRTRGH